LRDLLVTPVTPALGGGAGLRTCAVIRALAAWRGVDVVYTEFGGGPPAPEVAELDNVRLEALQPSRGPRRALAYATARARGVPVGFARGVSPELVAAAAAQARAPDRGRIIADGPIAAAALRRMAGRRPSVYLAHNLESAFRADDHGHPRAVRSFERGLLQAYAETWMVSRAEVDAAIALSPGAHVRYVPNVVDTAAIDPVNPAAEPAALFVGDFTYSPNREGLAFLVDEVMPRLWRRAPSTHLRLVGRGLDDPPSQDPRIEALGFVDDLRAAYAGAAVAVVPLLRGGGTPLKFLEALAYEVPVVATPAAAAGLEVAAGVHFLEADGPVAFAEALARVLQDGAAAMAERGRQLVAKRYSIQALTELLIP
jgi:glycosyltransferase involved in cell wall biosynthesis